MSVGARTKYSVMWLVEFNDIELIRSPGVASWILAARSVIIM